VISNSSSASKAGQGICHGGGTTCEAPSVVPIEASPELMIMSCSQLLHICPILDSLTDLPL